MRSGKQTGIGILLLVLLLVAGCSTPPPPPGSAGAPPANAAAPASSGCMAEAPAPPADARKVTVSYVVDGDTVHLADGEKVRLIGINTPESVDPRRPVQAYGKEASAFAKQLLLGQEIWLREGTTPRDRYGRLLAWLWLPDGRFVNALLVAEGYAQVYTFADNPDNAPLLVACQREARAENRGLWALPEYKDGQEAAKMDRSGSTSGAAPGPATGAADGPKAEIVREPGRVAAGETATVTARTEPGAACAIQVIYKSGPSSSADLTPRTADASGQVTWTWRVGRNTTPGTWPVRITCGGPAAETELTVH